MATVSHPATDLTGYVLSECKNFTRKRDQWMVRVLGASLVIALLVIAYLADRKVVYRYIRIDGMGRASVIAYNDLDYTPEAGEIKAYLGDWARDRYQLLPDSAVKNFANNYYFVSEQILGATKTEDHKENLAAKVAAHAIPGNDLRIDNILITSLAQKKRHGGITSGTAIIQMTKQYPDNETGTQKNEHWTVSVNFVVDPAQVAAQSEKDPMYQMVNPLGLSIVYFHADQANY